MRLTLERLWTPQLILLVVQHFELGGVIFSSAGEVVRPRRDAGVGLSALSTATSVASFITSFIKQGTCEGEGCAWKGKYIRFLFFGALDGQYDEPLPTGWTSRDEKLKVWENSPEKAHLGLKQIDVAWITPLFSERSSSRWGFDGPHLVTYRKDRNSYSAKMHKLCLDYFHAAWINMTFISTTPCEKYRKKGWFLKVHGTHPVDVNGSPRFLFSLHSEDDATKFLTVRTAHYNDAARAFEHTIEDIEFSRTVYTPRVFLTLENCSACGEQSFFVDANYLDLVEKLHANEISSIAPPTYKFKQCINSRYEYPYEGVQGMRENTINGIKDQLQPTKLSKDQLVLSITSGGEVCKNACAKNGYSYFWCDSTHGWDYCSPEIVNDVKRSYSIYGNAYSIYKN
ncbi:hypothetical protein Fcan01_16606 [Folsomia candida]|uniref:Uncharacterized protein n=1 Tax=Folsomia candida TaxID=158441 RepID=A0A226DVK1_FOLCA|nr:hypothetical protein Fcan01_16606 [Folsomia candida]